jgi:hypothetical protein
VTDKPPLSPLVALGVLGLIGCTKPPAPAEQRFEATLRVTSDDASPLPGAKFSLAGKPFGETDLAGTLSVRLRGTEGQMVRLSLECPEGYAAPEHLSPLRLTQTRRMGQSTPQPLTLDAVCTRQTRKVALIVQGPPGTPLPVQVNGTQLTSTDVDGNAHLLLEVDRSQRTVTARLDTQSVPDLVPQNPERVFELSGRDSLLFFAPELTKVRRPAPRRAAPAAPRRHIPYRID